VRADRLRAWLWRTVRARERGTRGRGLSLTGAWMRHATLPHGLLRLPRELAGPGAAGHVWTAGEARKAGLPRLAFARLVLPAVVVDSGHPPLADVHPRAEHTVEPDRGVGVGLPPPAPPPRKLCHGNDRKHPHDRKYPSREQSQVGSLA
jgi:hypothetical protein